MLDNYGLNDEIREAVNAQRDVFWSLSRDLTDEEQLATIRSVAKNIIIALPSRFCELRVLSLIMHIYDMRRYIDEPAKMARQLMNFFLWMYRYGWEDEGEMIEDNTALEGAIRLSKIFKYFYEQDSAVITQDDCRQMMWLLAKYYRTYVNAKHNMHIGCLEDGIELLTSYEASVLNANEEERRQQIVNGYNKCFGYYIGRLNYLKNKSDEKVEKGDNDMETDEEMITCYQCGEVVPKSTATKDCAGDWFCETCASEHLSTCEECGAVVWADDMYWVEHEGIEVCPRCADRYFETCHECGTLYRRSEMIQDNNCSYYCPDCYNDLFTECDECGAEVRTSDAYYTDNGRVLCPECHEAEECCIHDYHDSSVGFELLTYDSDEDAHVDDLLTIGIEHEIAGDVRYGKEFLEIVNPSDKYGLEDRCALFHDSSVQGFEVVTQPMTLQYLKKEFLNDYKKGMKFLAENGFKGRNEGGLHIHFKVPHCTSMHVAKMCNILYGSLDNDKALRRLSRRLDSELYWCGTDNRTSATSDILALNLKDCSGERRTALHYDTRTRTHELRIFNSTLDFGEYVASIEFVVAMVHFVQTDTGVGPYVTLRDLVQFIYDYRETFTEIHRELECLDLYDYFHIGPKQLSLPAAEEDIHISDMDTAWINYTIADIFSRPLEELV